MTRTPMSGTPITGTSTTGTSSTGTPVTGTLWSHARIAPVVLCVFFTVASAWGQGLETTDDLGVRIAQDDIIQAIQEQSEFWPPVRQHVASKKFHHVADAATRTEAVAFLKGVHDELHDRLMGENEERAMDLIAYLGHRLRVFAIYRQVRDVVDNEAAMVALVDHWDVSQRQVLTLPTDKRLARSEEIVAEMRGQMTDLGLSAEAIGRAMPIWHKQGECLTLLLATDAGQQMIQFDGEIRQKRPAVMRLIRRVAASAEWAAIAQTDTSDLIGRAEFVKAWETLERHEVARTASAPR
jgi:hypothetical protein